MLDRDYLRLHPTISESELMIECGIPFMVDTKVLAKQIKDFPRFADKVLGNCSCLVVGDFGQLLPLLVMCQGSN